MLSTFFTFCIIAGAPLLALKGCYKVCSSIGIELTGYITLATVICMFTLSGLVMYGFIAIVKAVIRDNLENRKISRKEAMVYNHAVHSAGHVIIMFLFFLFAVDTVSIWFSSKPAYTHAELITIIICSSLGISIARRSVRSISRD